MCSSVTSASHLPPSSFDPSSGLSAEDLALLQRSGNFEPHCALPLDLRIGEVILLQRVETFSGAHNHQLHNHHYRITGSYTYSGHTILALHSFRLGLTVRYECSTKTVFGWPNFADNPGATQYIITTLDHWEQEAAVTQYPCPKEKLEVGKWYTFKHAETNPVNRIPTAFLSYFSPVEKGKDYYRLFFLGTETTIHRFSCLTTLTGPHWDLYDETKTVIPHDPLNVYPVDSTNAAYATSYSVMMGRNPAISNDELQREAERSPPKTYYETEVLRLLREHEHAGVRILAHVIAQYADRVFSAPSPTLFGRWDPL